MAAQIEASVSAEIYELIKSLKKNPIFHMSLGSRELFHSNFLAWLGERHLPTLLNGLLNDNVSPPKWGAALEAKSVEREKHNIDLLVEFKHSGQECLLAVEVKVKDVLRPTQLSEYDKAIDEVVGKREIARENVYKVALTLTEPSGKFPTWQVVNFQELSKRLLSIDSSLKGDNEVFLRYYREFIHDLSRLTARVAEVSDASFTELSPFAKNIFPDLEINEKLEKDLRLHSTFGKLLATRLAHSLTKELTHSDVLEKLHVHYDSSESYKGDGIFIAASGGFERGNAFTSISVNKWVPNRESGANDILSTGIMLQNGEYRLIISHSSFNFKRGRANDELRRNQMYECANKVQCLDWLQGEKNLNLHGYAPKYIYTVRPIPRNREDLGRQVICDLTKALHVVEQESQRLSG